MNLRGIRWGRKCDIVKLLNLDLNIEIGILFKIWSIVGLLWIIFVFSLNIKCQLHVNIVEQIIVWIIVIFLGIILIPGFYHAKANGKLAICENNLKNIGVSIEMYAEDNEGYFPPTLDVLKKLYMKSIPVCPVSGKPYIYIGKKIYINNLNDNNFILYCSKPDVHIKADSIKQKGCWPQYISGKGIILNK